MLQGGRGRREIHDDAIQAASLAAATCRSIRFGLPPTPVTDTSKREPDPDSSNCRSRGTRQSCCGRPAPTPKPIASQRRQRLCRDFRFERNCRFAGVVDSIFRRAQCSRESCGKGSQHQGDSKGVDRDIDAGIHAICGARSTTVRIFSGFFYLSSQANSHDLASSLSVCHPCRHVMHGIQARCWDKF